MEYSFSPKFELSFCQFISSIKSSIYKKEIHSFINAGHLPFSPLLQILIFHSPQSTQVESQSKDFDS